MKRIPKSVKNVVSDIKMTRAFLSKCVAEKERIA